MRKSSRAGKRSPVTSDNSERSTGWQFNTPCLWWGARGWGVRAPSPAKAEAQSGFPGISQLRAEQILSKAWPARAAGILQGKARPRRPKYCVNVIFPGAGHRKKAFVTIASNNLSQGMCRGPRPGK